MRRRRGSVAVLVVLLAAFAAWLLKTNARGPLPVPPAGQSERIDAARLRVLDGDTVKYGDATIRLLGIDAPERRSPHFPGDQEPHATKAKEYLEGLLAHAKEVRFVRVADPDPHQRVLAYLIADGVNVNAAMVRAGHAYENVTHFGEQGLKTEAQQVLAAAKGVRPAFEAPWRWRNRAKGQGAPR